MIPSLILILAQEDGGGLANSLPTFAIIAVFIAIFYFLLIRPGQKQRKAHQDLVNAIKKGDEVLTAGGLYGTVTRVDSENVKLEIAKKTEIKLAKNSIARVVNASEEEEEDYEEDEDLEEEFEDEEFDEEFNEEHDEEN